MKIPDKLFVKITSCSILAYRPEEIDQNERQDDMELIEYQRVQKPLYVIEQDQPSFFQSFINIIERFRK
ncbi:MAG: hypothetical protein AB7H97_06340 [Pseudobdellovibrionaceae bacterium]